ncbi:MAG: outer membrane protein assembly factor BamB [Woeseiaceae bacterium]
MKFIFVTLVLVMLNACGSSPSSVLPPLALTPLNNSVEVSRVWKFTAGEGVSDHYLKLTPAMHNNVGYAIDSKGFLQSFNVTTGRISWEQNLNFNVASGLILSNNHLYIGTSKGELISLKLEKESVKEVWRAQLTSEILAKVAISQNILVAKTIDGRVYGLDSNTGIQVWVHDRTVPRLTLRGSSSPLISNDMVLIASDNGKLSALSLKQGKLLWETTVSIVKGRNQLERIIDIDLTPVVVEDVVYIAGYQGRIAAVKLVSGELIWARDFSTYSGLYVDAFRVYVSDAMGQVWALNRYNGSTLWRQDKLLRRKLTAPNIYHGHVVVGDYDGYLHWLTLDDGKLVARKQINKSEVIVDDEPSDPGLDLLFSKWSNILVKPLVANDLLISLDRSGHLEAFKTKK